MANCEHCGTEYVPRAAGERYCCRGCEFVSELISEQGLGRFYDLRQGLALAPVKSRPFEEHDFGWLAAKVEGAEARASAKGGLARLDLALEGISCVGCVWLVEKLFSQHAGAVRAMANPASGRLRVEWEAGRCALEAFLRELCQFGYVAAPVGAGWEDGERRKLAVRLGLCGAFMLNTMAFSLPMYVGMTGEFELSGLFRLIAFGSASLSMLVGGGYFVARAWRGLRAGSLHMDLPIALGLIAAYLGSIAGWLLGHERLLYFDFVATFVFLMLAGRWLQTAAVEKNRRRLVRQQPVPAVLTVVGEDGEQPLAREELKPGCRFRWNSGQALAVSGILAEGEADVSLEWIHGEAEPVRFTAGSRLPAGAILLSRSPVTVRAEECWEDSLLARLTAGEEQERGSPGLERLLRRYLAVVIVVGVAAFAYWGLRGAWLTGVQAMISVFVVSCPCALGVAVPLADDRAAAAVARLGVFVRSASIWTRLRRVKRVVFDKTGTLTLERPVLEHPEEVALLEEEAAEALARLTSGSLHPVSRALLEALGLRGQKLLRQPCEIPVEESPGLGVAWGEWSLGKIGWSGRRQEGGNGKVAAQQAGSELRRRGQRVATFHFREELRPGALGAVRRLERRGLELFILSGDHPAKVAQMARSLDLPQERARGGLAPEEKSQAVKELGGEQVLYLGDGANDSLAFDAAWVTGTPVVDRSLLESKADFYTLGAGLSFLPDLLEAAARRVRGVRAAFGFALLYNITVVALSVAGKMSPLVAAIVMPLSSVVSIAIVTTSGRRGLK